MEAIRRLPAHGTAGTEWLRTAGAWLLATADVTWDELIAASKAARLMQLGHVKLRRF